MTSARLTGADEIKRKLEQIGRPATVRRIVRKVARKAMVPVRDAAKNNARLIDDPNTKEKIWKNIAINSKKSTNPDVITMRVGVRGGASFSNPNPPSLSGGDTRHWRWKELGAEHMQAEPFMQPALYSNVTTVINVFSTEFSKELDLELAKR